MKGLPKTRLEELRNLLIGESLAKSFIESLLAECEELPRQQWQTIEEFKASPVVGWCWIKLTEEVGGDTELAFHNEDSCFYDNSTCIDELNVIYISHVMPIKTPEAPK